MKITDKEIKLNNVKSAPDMLTAMGDTTTEDVKNVFDRLPELIARKHNRLVDYVNDTLKNPQSDEYNICFYTHPSQFGVSCDSTMQEIYVALPANSIAHLKPSALVDESWNLPTTNGFVQIIKGETSGKIILWGRQLSTGFYICDMKSSGMPTGEWQRLLLSGEADTIAQQSQESYAMAYEASQSTTQLEQQLEEDTQSLDMQIASLEADLGIVGATNFDSVAVAANTVVTSGSITLPAGSFVVQFGGYFGWNSSAGNTGWRKVHLNSNADGSATPPRRCVLTGNGVDTKATYLTGTTFFNFAKETTLYLFVEHNAAADVNFYGYINTMQITGETVTVPDLSGGGSVDIYG